MKNKFLRVTTMLVMIAMLVTGAMTSASAVLDGTFSDPEGLVFVQHDQLGKVLVGTNVGTTVQELSDNYSGKTVETKRICGRDALGTELLGTGCVVTVKDSTGTLDTFTTIIYGDVNGDGAIISDDLLAMKIHQLGVSALGTIAAFAADINHDGAFNSIDLLAMNMHMLGINPISQLPSAMPKTVKILPLGDSITQGNGTPSAYRYALYEDLYSAGTTFEFVGPQKSSDFRLPDKYSNHAGYGGYTIGPDQSSIGNIYDILPNILNRDFDIVLLMLGRNNYFQNIDLDKIDVVYENLMRKIYETNPNAIIYAASLPVMKNGAAGDRAQTELNVKIPGICQKLTAEGKNAHFVDMAAANMTPSDYGGDIVHPNEAGNKKLADVWYNSIVNKVRQINAIGDPNYVSPIRVSGISLDKSDLALEVDSELTLKATISPQDAEAFTVLWSSDNTAVATVSDGGKVTALKQGTATITARSLDGGKIATCNVTVNPKSTETQYANVFADSFSNADNWTGDVGAISNGAFSTSYSGATKTITSKNAYNLGSDFQVVMNYSVSDNEKGRWSNTSSFKVGGFEVRIADCASSVELVYNGKSLGRYDGNVVTGVTSTYTLTCSNGTVIVKRGGELLISAQVSNVSVNSNVTIVNGEPYRNCSIYDITLKKAI